MPFQRSRRAVLVAASLSVLAACGGGDSIVDRFAPERVIAFGDAFSDVGQAGTRYTVNNGSATTWTQQLAARYGRTLTASSAGGLSYATGNARVTATPDAAGGAAPSISQQISNFLAGGGSFRASDLVIVSGGISDVVVQAQAVIAGTQSEAQARASVEAAGRELAAQVRRVLQAGAQRVLVTGAYELHRSPWAVAAGRASLVEVLTSSFNQTLKLDMVDLDGRKVLYVDANSYFSLLTEFPGNYGFNNATSVACTSVDPGPGIGIGAGQVNSSLCNDSTIAAGIDPATSLWADPVYPTPRAHVLFGDRAYELVRQYW